MSLGCLIAAVGIIFALAVSIFPADIADYRARIGTAQQNVTGLRVQQQQAEGSMPREILDETLRLIPQSEWIDLPGTRVETNNAWLHEGLGAIASAEDPETTIATLLALEERLAGISEKLRELETASEAGISKDENKQKIGEILRRAEYLPPQQKGESLFQQWIREFTEWLARVFPRIPAMPANPSASGSLQFWLQIVLFVIVIAIIGFVVYRFAPYLRFPFRRRARERLSDRVILGERVSGDVSARDIFDEAEALARQGDLRGAIRKGYISLLCDLHDRKSLRLARHKTNRDYLRDVKGNARLSERMRHLTGSYERNWYGLRTVEPGEWEEFREGYVLAVRQAGEEPR